MQKEKDDSRKEKGTSPKDLDLAKSEQDKIKGGTVEKQTIEKQNIEKQSVEKHGRRGTRRHRQ
ncbi:MAG TPA: hypothetical protein VJ719_04120 [Chthoniobacterales bacterium]|nr:hypothetical protein [Chthoniobacterales bacterium]